MFHGAPNKHHQNQTLEAQASLAVPWESQLHGMGPFLARPLMSGLFSLALSHCYDTAFSPASPMSSSPFLLEARTANPLTAVCPLASHQLAKCTSFRSCHDCPGPRQHPRSHPSQTRWAQMGKLGSQETKFLSWAMGNCQGVWGAAGAQEVLAWR